MSRGGFRRCCEQSNRLRGRLSRACMASSSPLSLSRNTLTGQFWGMWGGQRPIGQLEHVPFSSMLQMPPEGKPEASPEVLQNLGLATISSQYLVMSGEYLDEDLIDKTCQNLHDSRITNINPLPFKGMMLLMEELNFENHMPDRLLTIRDLDSISQYKKLKRLNVGGNGAIRDLSPLYQCPGLKELIICSLPLKNICL